LEKRGRERELLRTISVLFLTDKLSSDPSRTEEREREREREIERERQVQLPLP
jgi:hypothetical protein